MVVGSQRCDLHVMVGQECIRHRDQTAIWLARQCAEDGFELGRAMNGCGNCLYREGQSAGFECAQVIGIGRRRRVEQEDGSTDVRRDLLEQLQPLAGRRCLNIGETSGVAAGPRHARDETAADRIGDGRENDGDCAGFAQQRRGDGCVLRKNELGLLRDEFFRRSLSRPHVVTRGPASMYLDVATLHPPELLKFLPECGDEALSYRVTLDKAHQHANSPRRAGLLRACVERP